ncbi:hypothetical protein GUITHDRAFT_161179, partial [Guillardia theta CCMP2712]
MLAMAAIGVGSPAGAFVPHLPSGLTQARHCLARRNGDSPLLRGVSCRAPYQRQAAKLKMQEMDRDGTFQRDESDNVRRYGLLIAWACFMSYGIFFAPEVTEGASKQILLDVLDPSKLQTINPIFFAVFNLLGVWPAVMASLLFPLKPISQKLPASPFIFGSFALGAFALTPYLALTSYGPETDKDSMFSRFFQNKITSACLLIFTVGLYSYGAGFFAPNILNGGSDYSIDVLVYSYFKGFIELFRSIKLVNVSSCDFIFLWLLSSKPLF